MRLEPTFPDRILRYLIKNDITILKHTLDLPQGPDIIY